MTNTHRRTLLSIATTALHELLRDEAIEEPVTSLISTAQDNLLEAYQKLEAENG